MSFHPLMVYDRERFQRSERKLVEEGPEFTFTRRHRDYLDDRKFPRDESGGDATVKTKIRREDLVAR